MKYQVLEKNERHVDAIARSLKKSDALYLATDPDREGEAIAWHLKEILTQRGDLDGKQVHRVVFYEITRNAIRAAVEQPRGLSLDLVNAQQARRALDYLVGFNLSPLLWKKVRRGLSAGRVQSPALRMICEREEEIDAFKAQEYWTLDAEGTHGGQAFPLKAARVPRPQGRAVQLHRRERGARGRAHAQSRGAGRRPRRRSRPAQGHRHRPQAAPPQPGAAVHDLDPAAGGGAQARLQCAAHHARSRSSCTRAWTSARAASASSPTCAPTR